MIGTFLYFSWLSFRNRIVHRVRRLRQPRYLLSTLLGLAYFAWLIFGNGNAAVKFNGQAIPIAAEGMLIALSVLVFIVLLGVWALPGSAAGVTFTETEIQFLFPAPLSRGDLLLYKITRSQPGILFGAIMVRLFIVRGGHFVGVWLALVAIDLYFLMVAFARARLRQWGIGFVSRLVIVAVLFIVAAAITVHSVTALDTHALAGAFEAHQFNEVATRIGQVFFHGAAGVIYFVPALFARPAVATSVAGFAESSVVLLLIGFVCFRVATRLDVSFEDASLAASKKKAESLSRQRKWQQGRSVAFRHTPPLFKLGESGPPEVAIVWKNLIAAGRITLPILGLVFAGIVVIMGFVAMKSGLADAMPAAAPISIIFLVVLSFAGPLMFRSDLRLEVDRLDLIRLLPISGTRMVAAQIVAPAIIILTLQVVLLAVALVSNASVVDHATWLKYALWAPAALLLAAPIDLVQLLFQNGIVILLPAWARMTKEQSRGAEGIGRAMLLALGHALFLVVGLLPAALVFALGFWLASFGFDYGPAAGTIAAVPACMILWVEIVLIIKFLGMQYEELDVANDLEPWEA